MKNKTKQRKRYTPRRADYRTGGRVQFNAGQAARRQENERILAEQPSQPIEQAMPITPSRYGGGSTSTTPPSTS